MCAPAWWYWQFISLTFPPNWVKHQPIFIKKEIKTLRIWAEGHMAKTESTSRSPDASSFFLPNCRIWGKWSSFGPSVTWRFKATSALYLMLSNLFFPFNFCWLQHTLRHPSRVVLCKVTFQGPPVSNLIPYNFCVRCRHLDRCLCITSSLYSPRVGWKLIRFKTL